MATWSTLPTDQPAAGLDGTAELDDDLDDAPSRPTSTIGDVGRRWLRCDRRRDRLLRRRCSCAARRTRGVQGHRPAGAGRLRQLSASVPPHNRSPRPIGRRDVSPRRCSRCSMPPRRRSFVIPTRSARCSIRCWSSSRSTASRSSISRVSRSIPSSPRPWPTSPATVASRWSSDVLRSGYTWKGKVLRPAMVKTKD